jgi:hypothetical protein
MEAKLIKKVDYYNNKDIYYSLIIKDECIGTTHNLFNRQMNDNNGNAFLNKLSLENCQKIENGYDLDELADEYFRSVDSVTVLWRRIDFKKGFQKALEILGDKKFTEKDLKKAYQYGRTPDAMFYLEDGTKEIVTTNIENFIQSLQQTEWDVIILEEPIDLAFYENGNRFPIDANLPDRFKYKPLLDEDGCIILKRKI